MAKNCTKIIKSDFIKMVQEQDKKTSKVLSELGSLSVASAGGPKPNHNNLSKPETSNFADSSSHHTVSHHSHQTSYCNPSHQHYSNYHQLTKLKSIIKPLNQLGKDFSQLARLLNPKSQKLGSLWIPIASMLVLVVFVLFSFASFTEAATFTKEWTSQSDFETNTTLDQVDTTTIPGSVKLAANPDPQITFNKKFGSSGTGDGQFDSPRGIASDSNGNIYVADRSNHRIQVFSNDGTYLRQFGSFGSGDGQFDRPVGIVLDSNGNIYVAEPSRIQVFSNDGTYLRQFGSLGSGDGQLLLPYGVALDSNGTVYVADTYNHRIQVFSNDGTYLRQIGSQGAGDGQFFMPYRIAFDSNDNIYVVETNRVQVLSNDGTYLRQFGSLGSGDGLFGSPRGIASDSNDNIYVADTNNARIQVFSNDGTYLRQFGSLGSGDGQFDEPYDIAQNSNGSIYVADKNNDRVQILQKATPYYSLGTISGTGFQVDAGGEAIWSKLEWNMASVPDGTAAKFRAKTSSNGSDWSAWSDYITDTSAPYGQNLSLADSQYIELELTLEGGFTTPELTDFTLTYAINGSPEVTSVSASQSQDELSYGDVILGYDLADSDNATADVSYYYNTGITLSSGIDEAVQTITVNNTDNVPDSGTLIIDGEIIDYAGKTPTTFTGLTRGAESTRNISHDSASDIYVKCTTVTGGGERSSDTGSSYAGTWDVATDLPNTYLPSVILKVVANDGEAARNVGSGDSASFLVDTVAPAASGVVIAGKPRTNDENLDLTITASDSSTFYMDLRQTNDFGSTPENYQAYQDTVNDYTVPVGDGDKSAYVKFKDIYGNENAAVYSDTITLDQTAAIPTNFNLVDASNKDTANYRLVLLWDSSEESDFAKYSIERSINNDSNFSELAVLTNKSSNYLLDPDLSVDNTYYYRMRAQDDLGNWSSYTEIESAEPAGNDTDPPEITGPNPNATPGAITATISWITNELSDSFVEFGEDTNYGNTQGKNEAVTEHSITLVGLTPETTYHFRVRTSDIAGNTYVSDNLSFRTTPLEEQLTFPVISGSQVQGGGTDPEEATIIWTTDKYSTSQVEYGLSAENLDQETTLDTALNKSHVVQIAGLKPNTTYYYQAISVDQYDNETIDDIRSFATGQTAEESDTDPVVSSIDAQGGGTSPEEATIIWTTDKYSTSQVLYGIDPNNLTTYTELDTAYNKSHVVRIASLQALTKYYYKVISVDSFGNQTVSGLKEFTTAKTAEDSSTLPNINGASAQKVGADPEEATIIWTTDKYSTSQVLYGIDPNNLNIESAINTSLNKSHFIQLKGLQPNTKYYYRIVSVDEFGNRRVGELNFFITTQSSAGAPTISAVETTDITLSSAIVSWDTKVVATSIIEYGTDENYGSRIEDLSLGSTTKHLIRLKNLQQGQRYHFRISGLSAAGTYVYSDDYVFSTLSKPTITGISFTDISSQKATVSWTTDTDSNSFVDYGLDGLQQSQGRSEEVKDHSVTLIGLKPATNYQVQVKSRDKYSNQTVSSTLSLQTIVDTTPPEIKDLKSETSIINDSSGNAKAQVIISWSTDEPATQQVQYSEGTVVGDNYNQQTQEITSLTTSHVVIISDLKPSTTYHMKLISKDSSGNIGMSDDYTVLTQNQEKSLVQYIIQVLEQKFSWLKGLKLWD